MRNRFIITNLLIAAAGLLISPVCAPSQTIDEQFVLNIISERIIEKDFRRSKELLVENGDLRLKVGAAVSAGHADVQLFGITGNVRFRAMFDPTRLRPKVQQNPPKIDF